MERHATSIKISTPTITVMAWLLLYIYMTAYAAVVFMQFSIFEVLTASVTFIALFVFIAWPLIMGAWKAAERKIRFRSLICSSIIASIMVLLFHTAGPVFKEWVRTFPLMDAESNAGWHQDTAFHVSLIQSILNFGYPSTAAHAHPFMGYHVLSHYVDALVLLITRLDPFDSYGLFCHFKIFTYLSALLFFVDRAVRGGDFTKYILSVFLFFPLAIGSWHAIGSHGLWMSSLVTALSACYLYQLAESDQWNNPGELCKAALIIMLVACGKVSSGALMAAFMIPMIWLKQVRNKFVYLLIATLFIFFFFYNRLFTYGDGLTPRLAFPSPLVIYQFFVESGQLWTRVLNANLINVGILVGIALIFPTKSNWRIAFSGIVALTLLLLITKMPLGLGQSDIWYFQYGLASISTFFVFLTITKHCGELYSFSGGYVNSPQMCQLIRVAKFSFLGLLVVLGSFVEQPAINPLNFGPSSLIANLRSANLLPFESLNKTRSADQTVSIFRLISGKVQPTDEVKSRGVLGNLADELKAVAKRNHTSRARMLLHIPRDILEPQNWAYGLLVYAVTGTPLINGVRNLRKYYGFDSYRSDSLAVDSVDFDPKYACQTFHPDLVVMVKSIKPVNYDAISCRNFVEAPISGA